MSEPENQPVEDDLSGADSPGGEEEALTKASEEHAPESGHKDHRISLIQLLVQTIIAAVTIIISVWISTHNVDRQLKQASDLAAVQRQQSAEFFEKQLETNSEMLDRQLKANSEMLDRQLKSNAELSHAQILSSYEAVDRQFKLQVEQADKQVKLAKSEEAYNQKNDALVGLVFAFSNYREACEFYATEKSYSVLDFAFSKSTGQLPNDFSETVKSSMDANLRLDDMMSKLRAAIANCEYKFSDALKEETNSVLKQAFEKSSNTISGTRGYVNLLTDSINEKVKQEMDLVATDIYSKKASELQIQVLFEIKTNVLSDYQDVIADVSNTVDRLRQSLAQSKQSLPQ